MVEFLQPGTSLSWDLLWQSSLFLTVGLGASLALRRSPATGPSRPAPGHDRRALSHRSSRSRSARAAGGY